MSILLTDLISSVAARRLGRPSCGFRGTEVRGLTPDAAQVKPGIVYVALPERYQPDPFGPFEAFERGASVAICEPDTVLPRGLARIEVPDSRKAFVQAAAAFFRHPERRIQLVGIRRVGEQPEDANRRSSTNISHLVASLLNAGGAKAACFTELGCWIGDRRVPRAVSSLNPFEFFQQLDRAVRAGAKYAIIEVGSALGALLSEVENASWYEASGINSSQAEYGAFVSKCLSNGRRSTTGLLGPTNLAALSTALRVVADVVPSLSADPDEIKGTRGFLERLGSANDPLCVTDFARTASEVRRVLAEVRTFHPGPIRTLIGAPAAWSRNERVALGLVLSQVDHLCVTSDDPEFEDPHILSQDIVDGSGHGRIILDRAEAIADVVHSAQEGELLLFLGKAHSDVQRCEGTVIPWDDRLPILAALADRGYGGTRLEIEPLRTPASPDY